MSTQIGVMYKTINFNKFIITVFFTNFVICFLRTPECLLVKFDASSAWAFSIYIWAGNYLSFRVLGFFIDRSWIVSKSEVYVFIKINNWTVSFRKLRESKEMNTMLSIVIIANIFNSTYDSLFKTIYTRISNIIS